MVMDKRIHNNKLADDEEEEDLFMMVDWKGHIRATGIDRARPQRRQWKLPNLEGQREQGKEHNHRGARSNQSVLSA